MKAGWGTGGEKKKDTQETEAGKKAKKAGGKMCVESMLKQKHFHICSCQSNKSV
jgi:hypothetical protein